MEEIEEKNMRVFPVIDDVELRYNELIEKQFSYTNLPPENKRLTPGVGDLVSDNEILQIRSLIKEEAVKYGYPTTELKSDTMKTEFDKKLLWERKLLDLGLRNSLLNLHLSRSVVPILCSSLDRFEDSLYDGDSFILYSKPEGWETSEKKDDFSSLSNLGDFKEFIEQEYKSSRIHSTLTEGELNATMKNLYRNAKSSLEENGANSLFVAIGLLKWCEEGRATNPHFAPIVLYFALCNLHLRFLLKVSGKDIAMKRAVERSGCFTGDSRYPGMIQCICKGIFSARMLQHAGPVTQGLKCFLRGYACEE